MYFDHHEIQRAAERHRQLQVEARILRLIRASQAQHAEPSGPAAPPRRQPLLARVLGLIRSPGTRRAERIGRWAER